MKIYWFLQYISKVTRKRNGISNTFSTYTVAPPQMDDKSFHTATIKMYWFLHYISKM